MPQREIGGVLPPWEELVSISNYCRENKIHFHMDGARLWEVGPFYKKSYDEISNLFDSIYVSFYKGLNGIAGAILAGKPDFISESKVWLRRHGGNLIHLYPYIISADYSFTNNLKKMDSYFNKAKQIAEFLNSSPLLSTFPLIPQSNMVHVLFKEDKETVNIKLKKIQDEYNTFLFHRPSNNEYLDSKYKSKSELHIGDYSIEYDIDLLKRIITKYF